MSRQNKDLVLAYVDAFNRADLDALCNLFTADALIWGVFGWGDLKTVRPLWKELLECLKPNLQVEAIIAEADSVAVRYIERGTAVRALSRQGSHGPILRAHRHGVVRHQGRAHPPALGWRGDSATLAKQLGWDT